MSDSKASTKVIRRRGNESVTLGQPQVFPVNGGEKTEDLISIAERIAESRVQLMNWRFPNAEVHFPVHPLLRTIDRYFPYAKGGPLLVDEVVTDFDKEQTKRKADVLKKLGYRYLVLQRGMREFDARLVLEGVS